MVEEGLNQNYRETQKDVYSSLSPKGMVEEGLNQNYRGETPKGMFYSPLSPKGMVEEGLNQNY